jgi:putative intracellular protease/amidase
MPTTTRTAALLWDESHLWGLLLLRALHALSVPTTLLRAEQIRSGALKTLKPDTLLVPGGWARLKSLALEEAGRREIRDFVRGGGTYVGLCGGAGLALASEQGTKFLELCSWSRKPAKDRLPNFSGHLRCQVRADGPTHEENLPVWWPSQFAPDPDSPLEVLASYESPGADFWSADLDWSAVATNEIRQWEALYEINLDPGRLCGEPCIVRGRHGSGTFILSYAHLETPDSPQANALLARLLEVPEPAAVPPWSLEEEAPMWDDPKLAEMQATLSGLVRFGQSHFLLCWRTPWLLGWRRGVPGSPINFLLALTWQARHAPPTPQARTYWAEHGTETLRHCLDFCQQTREYLLRERRILATAPSSPEASASPGLQRHKLELFGKFPGYGGVYGEILGTLDSLLWRQLSASGAGTGRL